MKMKLNSDDRCAVDVVLESKAQGNGALESCYGKASASLQKHVRAAEKLFQLLDNMPAPAVPQNLVAHTLKFIKRHEHDVALPAPATHTHAHAPARTSGHRHYAHRHQP